MKSFREVLSNASNILILTGSGISAESGVPTFRGAGGFWRKYQAQNLATPEAFAANPSLVWEFYEYRRQLVSKVKPNKVNSTLEKFKYFLTILKHCIKNDVTKFSIRHTYIYPYFLGSFKIYLNSYNNLEIVKFNLVLLFLLFL